ncbi:MAG: UDP-N-acetylmuramoyl-tripeptide--D-alanyl-D-alanine ligase, partial [Lachnospiraceae bacterium]|nr:UDP-N-acetylmuramoyl-tripeptide--D-alanyl-D-alanine ligase [Lachnospiraceae bacterium]
MKKMTLATIAQAVGGTLHAEMLPAGISADHTEVRSVVLDSRLVEQGGIFIATRGEHVDGHSFISQVFEAGAVGVICEEALVQPKGAYILVESSFQALKDLAEYYRSQLDLKVVGITGSVGKTSTKEFVAGVLSQKYRVLKTEGNYNNEVGLPLTVLRIREDCEVAVLEMGISDFGEMHRLSKIAKPDVCLITNIGQCHLENLGTRDGILKAKSEIFDYMQEGGQICLNGDDDKLVTIREVRGSVPVFFGGESSNAVYADHYENRGLICISARIHMKAYAGQDECSFETEIPLPGEHMLYNALAATAVGMLFGLTAEQIRAGIRDVKAVDGRSHVIHTDRLTLIDDCYNANPVSVKAALDLLHLTELSDISEDAAHMDQTARKVAVLG